MANLAVFRSRVPIGSLAADDMRLVARAVGLDYWDLDRLVSGSAPDSVSLHDKAIKNLLRDDVGGEDLRKAVHAALIEAANQHIAYLSRKLDAVLTTAP